MKNIMLRFAILIFLFSGCSNQNSKKSITLNLDFEGAQKLVNVIKFIQNKNIDYEYRSNISSDRIDSLIACNREDKELNKLIDEVLKTEVYYELASIMQSYMKNHQFEGKESYREALLCTPYKFVNLRGGVDRNYRTLIKSWNNEVSIKLENLFTKLNSEIFKREILTKTVNWLPNEILTESYKEINLFVYFDGNRGHFQIGNNIYFDLMDLQEFLFNDEPLNQEAMTNVIAHELHHFLYGNWLKENTNYGDIFEKLKEPKRSLLRWQYGVLVEGTAHFLNWEDRPEFSQKMHLDNELGSEIFFTWDTLFNNYYHGKTSEEDFKKFQFEFNNGQALKWFKQNVRRFTEEDPSRIYIKNISQRPVLHYVVGIKIFREFYNRQGKEAVFELMKSPEKLLSEYFKLTQKDKNLPKISEKLSLIWQELL